MKTKPILTIRTSRNTFELVVDIAEPSGEPKLYNWSFNGGLGYEFSVPRDRAAEALGVFLMNQLAAGNWKPLLLHDDALLAESVKVADIAVRQIQILEQRIAELEGAK